MSKFRRERGGYGVREGEIEKMGGKEEGEKGEIE